MAAASSLSMPRRSPTRLAARERKAGRRSGASRPCRRGPNASRRQRQGPASSVGPRCWRLAARLWAACAGRPRGRGDRRDRESRRGRRLLPRSACPVYSRKLRPLSIPVGNSRKPRRHGDTKFIHRDHGGECERADRVTNGPFLFPLSTHNPIALFFSVLSPSLRVSVPPWLIPSIQVLGLPLLVFRMQQLVREMAQGLAEELRVERLDRGVLVGLAQAQPACPRRTWPRCAPGAWPGPRARAARRRRCSRRGRSSPR